jgi:hypothetical protein
MHSDVVSPFWKETLIKGRPVQLRCIEMDQQTYTVSDGPIRIVTLEDEWYEDVRDPAAVVETLTRTRGGAGADLFSFWQRVPDVEPRHDYHHEWEDVAVVPADHQAWLMTRIKPRIRSQLRKAEKEGLVLRQTSYDEAFVRGMTAIFNETPIRQGRPFWHYGKDVDTVRQQFSRYVHREHMIGAYYRDELIGFIMLGNAGRYGVTGQIISSVAHRDKATNVSLVGKAVEVAESLGLQYVVYLHWSEDSLGEFKRRSGFEPVRVPRYFVPVSARGRMALAAGLHRGWRGLVPPRMLKAAKDLRSRLYAKRAAERADRSD